MPDLKQREWIYIMKPTAYGISCDICGGDNIDWSEFEHRIWCYDCEKDTPGNGSIFDGPIPINICSILNISFDRICLKTKRILRMKNMGDHLEWVPKSE